MRQKRSDVKQYLKLLEILNKGGEEVLSITKGKIETAKKVVIYGPEGIGKSTLASKFPDPVFIDTEGSTKELDVARCDGLGSWYDIVNAVRDIVNERPCATLIIDTADWLEQLCSKYVCDKLGLGGIEDAGYGKGYTYLAEEFGKFLKICDQLIGANINVVFTAHAQMRKFEQPDEMGAYDRWEMKLNKKTAALLKEWADMVLFCNYKTTVIEDSKTKSKKAMGGKRVMYTTHHACWDAKNRYGLPDAIEMSFDQIAHLFTGIEVKEPEPDYRLKLREFINGDKELMAKIVNECGLGPDSTNEDYKKALETAKGGN